MSKYKALLFDFDDTLFDFPKSEKIALERVFDYYNIEKNEENLKTYIDENKNKATYLINNDNDLASFKKEIKSIFTEAKDRIS